MRESPGDRDLLRRARLEDPTVRAARRALERWTTIMRIWAAMDRLHLVDDGERIRFICRALWPSMSARQVDDLVARATSAEAEPTWQVRRPTRLEQVVGRDAAELIRGYELAVSEGVG